MRAYIVCGSRTFQDRSKLTSELSRLVWEQCPAKQVVIIHGDASGADRMAGIVARHRGANVIAMPYISALGKSGGPVRNEAMLSVLTALKKVGYDTNVIAFVDKPLEESRGTANMVGLARKAGIPVKVIETAPQRPPSVPIRQELSTC